MTGILSISTHSNQQLPLPTYSRIGEPYGTQIIRTQALGLIETWDSRSWVGREAPRLAEPEPEPDVHTVPMTLVVTVAVQLN